MFGIGAFILSALIFFITLFLLIDQEERRQILFPKQKLFFQFLWGVGLAGLFIAICAGMNLGLSSGFAAFQFRTLEIKQMAAFIGFLLLVAITEELFFRGYLTILGRRLQLDWKIIVIGSALLFGFLHWIFNGDVLQFVFAVVIGVVFSVVYQKAKSCSIYSLILAHFVYNLAILNVWGDCVKKFV